MKCSSMAGLVQPVKKMSSKSRHFVSVNIFPRMFPTDLQVVWLRRCPGLVVGLWWCHSRRRFYRKYHSPAANSHDRPLRRAKCRLWSQTCCLCYLIRRKSMMTSANGSLFCVTGTFCWEFIGHRWIPLTKGQKCGVLMFLWCWRDQIFK